VRPEKDQKPLDCTAKDKVANHVTKDRSAMVKSSYSIASCKQRITPCLQSKTLSPPQQQVSFEETMCIPSPILKNSHIPESVPPPYSPEQTPRIAAESNVPHRLFEVNNKHYPDDSKESVDEDILKTNQNQVV